MAIERIDIILKRYISEKIPKFATNIFWQMFNGINAMFTNLEYRLDITKRERNMLTAQHLSSLRHISAENGFEPKLKIPANGILYMVISAKLFNKSSYPLFLPPYSIFIDKLSKLEYYYNSNKTFKLINGVNYIPVVEGKLKTVNKTISTSDIIQKIFLQEENIAQNSINVEVNGIQFLEVLSFFDNDTVNDNKQFLVKFSNDIQNPIIIYLKGVLYNEIINITYKITSGEIGNIEDKHEFETQNIIDNLGSNINQTDDEITIINLVGFDLGSNGTDENALRAAIGYNHGKTLLFDNISYTNFLNKYSTLLVQKITNDPIEKTINNLYIGKKQSISEQNVISEYSNIINFQQYKLKQSEKNNLSKVLTEFEYALTSHVIYDIKTCKFAFQILMDSNDELSKYGNELSVLIYQEFSKFFYIKSYYINMENLFETFMNVNNIKFEYTIFNQNIEIDKINNKIDNATPYIIKHDEYLPILRGDFAICDSTFNPINLFFDINLVSK
jgi:hypothetical protein